MDISNKTLAMFLVAAIVVSIAGTTISLNKLGIMSTGGPTGYATTGQGNVSLDVGTLLSIVLDNNSIEFGTCKTTGAAGPFNISSHLRYGNQSVIAGSACNQSVSGNLPESIIIRNDGNQPADIFMNASKYGDARGGTFMDTSSNAATIWFVTINDSFGTNQGGCFGTFPYTTSTELIGGNYQNLNVCDNLENRGAAGGNAIAINVTITLPTDAVSDWFTFDIWATGT